MCVRSCGECWFSEAHRVPFPRRRDDGERYWSTIPLAPPHLGGITSERCAAARRLRVRHALSELQPAVAVLVTERNPFRATSSFSLNTGKGSDHLRRLK